MTRVQAFKLLRKEVIGECRWAVNAGTSKGLDAAKEFSSGTKSLQWLAANGHPYSTRYGAALDDFIVNSQTGEFKKDWFARYASGSQLTTKIGNLNPVADFLTFGTRFMRIRPIDQAVAAFTELQILEKLTVAARRLESL